MTQSNCGMQHAFFLPNGTPIRYAYPEDKRNQFNYFRSYETKRLIDTKDSKVKERRIKISCWNRSNQHLLFLDFDKVPNYLNSYDELADVLRNQLGDKARVARRGSNKV